MKDCCGRSIQRGMALLIPISVEAPPMTQIPTARNRILLQRSFRPKETRGIHLGHGTRDVSSAPQS